MSEQALHTPSVPSETPMVSRETLSRLDVQGPRYTSYPTADRFVEAYGPEQYVQALSQRGQGVGALTGGASALSLYVHIPFCESVCYYCACNKVITRHHERAEAYLADLREEIRLVAEQLGPGQTVSQLHFGGGTPTFLSDDELGGLLNTLRSTFRFVPGGEYAIEIDPRTIDVTRLKRLHQMGFNRLSFGVQDFDPDVQKAVHRVQPHDQVRDLVLAAREEGFESLNMDLIYGLPKQTPESFARTLAQVAALRPDRIALYAYAHLPQRFKPQRRIEVADLPKAEEKVGMLASAIDVFGHAGYDYIGMDHFALHHDSLAVAKRQGRLHRNFQGYSTYAECDLMAFGVSAIGKVGPTYAQNVKTLDEYYDILDTGRLPVLRGIELTADDLLRRAIIQALMCHFELSIESIEIAHLIDFKKYFAAELADLREMEKGGLLTIDDQWISVKPAGRMLVRAIAMSFDKYLRADRERTRYSKVI